MKSENNLNASGTEVAVTALNEKLTKIIEGASEVIKGVGGDNEPIGNVAAGGTDKAGMIFASDQAGAADTNAAKAAKDAYKAVGAVTGADILKAISSDKAVALAKNTGDKSNVNAATNAKDATVAGAIALRAMAKDGKFAGPTTSPKVEVAKAVKGAAVSAVTKALDTLTIVIRQTIDEGLKSVKEAMNISANDTPVTSETGVAAK